MKRSIGQWDSGTGHKIHLEIEDVLIEIFFFFLSLTLALLLDNLNKNINSFIPNLGVNISKYNRRKE